MCAKAINLRIFDLNGYKGDESANPNDNIFQLINTKNLKIIQLTNSTLTSKDCKYLFDLIKNVRLNSVRVYKFELNFLFFLSQ